VVPIHALFDENQNLKLVSIFDIDGFKHFSGDERTILTGLHNYISKNCMLVATTYIAESGSATNIPTTTPIKRFLGWALYSRLWPYIVSKMFAYGLNLPAVFKSALDSRFNTNKQLIELMNIATQGMVGSGQKFEHMDLLSTLNAWPIPDSLKDKLSEPKGLIEKLCNQQLSEVLPVMEAYLEAMLIAYMKYMSTEGDIK
jgi:hypothetical protein